MDQKTQLLSHAITHGKISLFTCIIPYCKFKSGCGSDYGIKKHLQAQHKAEVEEHGFDRYIGRGSETALIASAKELFGNRPCLM